MSGGKPRQEEGDDPFSQFDFLVDFGGGLEGGFQEMSGLGLAGPGQVALKRGAIAGSAWLWDWHRAGKARGRRVRIRMRDEARRPVMTWTLTGAWPVTIEGAPGSAGTDAAVIESLALACDGIATDEG